MSSKQKDSILFLAIFLASLGRPSEGAFGIPDFLELGRCFNATLQDGFDPVKYQGVWFSIQSVPNEYEYARRCVSMNYTWMEDRLISVGRGLTDEGKKIKQNSQIAEECELREPPHPAYMTVFADGVPESPYEILSTDYITYSCVHSCLEYVGFKAEFFWVFGRTPYLSQKYVGHCHGIFNDLGVNITKLEDIPHDSHCPYTKRLEEIFEYNRRLMIQHGLLDENSPRISSVPPPTAPPTVIPKVNTDLHISFMDDQRPKSGQHGDETMLEDPEDGLSSSSPLKTSDVAIPLFVIMAVLLPVLGH